MIIKRTPRPSQRPAPCSGAASLEQPSKDTALLLGGLALAAGVAAWIFYLQQDMILSHYDAKAHLVVARRVIDSLTPGWRQIGAVWLPLPHLIQLLPVQVDLFYRSGAFASLVSIACFGIAVWASARLILLITRSRLGAWTAAALLILNPNLLYLQATPMTEPLLVAVTLLVVLWLYEWVNDNHDAVPRRLEWALFAAAWSRYEGWAVLGSALAAVVYVMWRAGLPSATIIRRTWRLARWPAAAVMLFLVNSRITVGDWLVTGGFYVPNPTYDGQASRTLIALWWGTHQLSGYVVEIVALLTAGGLLIRGMARRAEGVQLLPIALFAAAAVPFFAFFEGHPFRIRYMVPLVATCALFAGIAAGTARRASRRAGLLLATLLIGSEVVESPPWGERAPLLQEVEWDVPISLNRREVTACLAGQYRGEKVLASMGSLAHYMQELSREGFAISDFIHEGNGDIWQLALETGPALHAGWMLVEEEAEGGDLLALRIRRDSAFIHGMTRVCEGGGVALYERD